MRPNAPTRLTDAPARPAASAHLGNGKPAASLDRSARLDAIQPTPEPAPMRPLAVDPLLFEVSWEVCSQAGGIYTVLRSKAPSAMRQWGDRYFLIGPYHEPAARIEFEAEKFDGPVDDAVRELAARGVVLHCGRWLISGRPRVILVDLNSIAAHFNDMKYFFWKDHGIGTPAEDHDASGIIGLGYVTADLLEGVQRRLGGRPVLVQCHEWQGAVAIPLLRRRKAKISTLFTTHATLVGRALSAANFDLYASINSIDPHLVARQHGFENRFLIERAAAQDADTFSTVSDITALEAEHFLGRRPDVLLPNGLNVERFAAPHEFQVRHQQSKELIHEFVMGHFFPSYRFDLDKTLYVFTAGRYEYRNKGFDIFIDSLAELNRRLRAEPNGTTVVAFIIARAAYRGLNVDTLNRQAMFNELRDTCHQIKEDMGRRLFRTVADGRMPTTEDLLDESPRLRLMRMLHAWSQRNLPTVVTHDLVDDAGDPVIAHLRRCNLANRPDDPVKVVFVPEFINTASPVLGMEYDQFVRGCNLGVFASYYEPWGYTPMECVVRGIPAITSDLSGFGAYVMEHCPDHDANGLYVARRRGAPAETTVYQVTGWLHALTRMSLRDRIALRNRVEAHAEYFDWKNMTRYYRAALRDAFQRQHPDEELFPPEVVEQR